jgi:DNA-binding transcriptional MerR regulator
MKETAKQVEKIIGVAADTVRYYRECDILHPHAGENGYYTYSADDMMKILLTREMRSMDISLKEAVDFFENRTIDEYFSFLKHRKQVLDEKIRLLLLESERMSLTEQYASCGLRLIDKVEEFDGPGTWTVNSLGVDEPYVRGKVLSKWAERFPFTYVSATILQKDLKSTAESAPYPVTMGIGCLEGYISEFSLPLPEYAIYQPGGHFIRTCIHVGDLFHITPKDLEPLHRYVKEHKLRFASCTGGRILFSEEKFEKNYYLLVWVKVESED